MIVLPFLESKIYEIVAVAQDSTYNFILSIRTLVCIILERMFVFCKGLFLTDVLLGKWAGCTKIFFMRLNGESMNKVLPNNTWIAVKKFDICDIKNGDIVVFSNDQEYSVKRMYRSAKIYIKIALSNPL